MPHGLFIRPKASSRISRPSCRDIPSVALPSFWLSCRKSSSAALSLVLLLLCRCRRRNFHSSYTVLIAPRTRLHRVHFDIVELLASIDPQLLHKRGISISRKSQTYLARLGIGLSRVPLLGLLGVVRDRPGALAELLGLNLRRHFELMEGLVVKARRKEKRKVVLSSSSS